MSVCAVIMAGGSGSRLWPLSRSMYPKQFLSVFGDSTLLQSTLERVSRLDLQSLQIVCNEEHRFFVAEELRKSQLDGEIILEPVSRNTAPAVALAALALEDDPLLLVMSSDHIIQNEEAFVAAINAATPEAESGKLLTFGVKPRSAHVGYGYIKTGKSVGEKFEVQKFVEKPSIKLARSYFDSGDYYWNSGIFLFKASCYLHELEKYRPDIYKSCVLASNKTEKDSNFSRVDKTAFALAASESIDFAIMEKTKNALVMPVDMDWCDIGSWSSLWDISDKDSNGNVKFGDVISYDAKNSFVRSEDKLTCTLGVEDLVVVTTKDVVLVAHKSKIENLKVLTDELERESRVERDFHQVTYRPWGKFESLDQGEGYQVKRITVRSGEKLSLQKHRHRSEHWVVVAGIATVTKGTDTFRLHKNESTYIPLGEIHSLENSEESDLEIIEVQSGSYLGEDDIIRFEDRYGRSPKEIGR